MSDRPSLLSRIFGPRRPKAIASSPKDPLDDFWYSRFPHLQHAGVFITPESSLQISVVWACVDSISKALASCPWRVISFDKSRRKTTLFDDPLSYLLDVRPNKEMTAIAFREAMLFAALTWGNAYAEIQRDLANRVVALHPILPDRVSIRRLENLDLVYDVHNPDGRVRTLAASDVYHLHGPGIHGFMGDCLVARMACSIALASAQERFASTYFGNNTILGGVIETPKILNEDTVHRMQKSWEDAHKGPDKAHRVAILENGTTYKQIQSSAENAQLIESRKFQVLEICRFYGVPPHKVMSMDSATYCMPADVEVFTEYGPKSIAEVKEGDRVWSKDGSNWKLANVKHSVCSGEDEILEFRTTNRTVRCNAKHRILVRRKKTWKVDPPVIGTQVRVGWETEYVEAGDLKVGDTLVTLDELPKDGTTVAPNGRKLTPGFMSFCGLLLGDGNVVKGGVTVARWSKSLYMDAYRKIIREEFVAFDGGNQYGRREDRPTRPVHFTESQRATRFSSTLAEEELTELGFKGDSRTKSVPDWVFGTTEELRLAFLRGCVDSDGSVSKKGRTRFDSVNKRMLSQIRHLCISVGIPVTNLRRQAVHTRLPNGKMFDGEIFSFTCSDPEACSRIGSFDSRYVERWAANSGFDKKDRNYPRYGGRDFDETGCSLSKITEIRLLSAEPVYDLEIEGTHNFVANGVVVHNSNIEHQSIEWVRDGLTPWALRIEQEADYKLFPDNGVRRGRETELDTAWLTQGDARSRAEAYRIMRETGVYSVNEIRAKEGDNDIGPEGDIRLLPLNMQTYEQLLLNQERAEVELERARNPQPIEVKGTNEDDAEDDDREADQKKIASNNLDSTLVVRTALATLFSSVFDRYAKRIAHRAEDLERTMDSRNVETRLAAERARLRPWLVDECSPAMSLARKISGSPMDLDLAVLRAVDAIDNGQATSEAAANIVADIFDLGRVAA